MAEPFDNIRGVHAHCAPRPIQVDHPLASLVGRYVKKSFPCLPVSGGPVREHMWVQVTDVHGDFLVGILSNDPVGACGFRNGDRVFVARGEIEDVS